MKECIKYDIRVRVAILGITYKKLYIEVCKRGGYIEKSDFYKAFKSQCTTPAAERAVEIADTVLTEWEHEAAGRRA